MVCYFYVTIFIDSFFRSELNHRKKSLDMTKKFQIVLEWNKFWN